MKRLLLASLIGVLIYSLAFADFPGSPIGGSSGSGTTSASDLSSGTLPAARIGDNSVTAAKIVDNTAALIGRFWSGSGDYLKSDGTQGTPGGSGTVTGPATATEDNFPVWGADNVTLKNSSVSSVNPAFTTLNVVGANALNLGATGVGTQGSIRLKSGVTANSNYFYVIVDNTGAGLTGTIGWTLPVANAGGANYLLNSSTAGVISYTDPATFAPSSSTSTAADWNKWDGGSTGLTAATGRTSLGLGGMALIDNGALTDTKTCIYTTGVGIVCNTTPQAGGGTVSGPATATEDNVVTWGADNTTIKDSGVALSALATLVSPTFTGVPAAPSAAADTNTTQLATTAYVIGQGYAKLVSPAFTTPNIGSATGSITGNAGTATALASDPADCSAGQVATGIAASGALSCTADLTLTTVSAGSFISTAADNTRGVTVPNTADPTGADLAAGKCWWNTTANTWVCRNGDNTVTTIVGTQVKTFSFVIDNVVVATDNILLMKVPIARTITQADCYASTDNVVGSLMECATDNVTSCTELDAWTVTNAVTGFADSSMTDGAVAAGAWLRWSTTSVGTTNSNKLSCTVRYRE